jgi:hypothetical protein
MLSQSHRELNGCYSLLIGAGDARGAAGAGVAVIPAKRRKAAREPGPMSHRHLDFAGL